MKLLLNECYEDRRLANNLNYIVLPKAGLIDAPHRFAVYIDHESITLCLNNQLVIG